MNRWFRMYDELLDDPKVQRLSGDDFKAWVNMLCLASRNGGVLPSDQDIAFALRIDEKKASKTVARFVSAGLIDVTETGHAPHGWDARQYKSDVSTPRVKRFRGRSKPVSGNADETLHETPPEAETETDVPLAKANGAESVDPDTAFWTTAKAYLAQSGIKNPGAVVGSWIRDHGKTETADALTRAQLERAVEPVPFIQGCFRHRKAAAQPVVPL